MSDFRTKAKLLAAPHRRWDKPSIHHAIYLVPTGELHDSGYGLIAIVGEGKEGLLLAAICDDITWDFPLNHPYDYFGKGHHSVLRTDCMPDGTLRMWGSSEVYFSALFEVGISLSSTTIRLFIQQVESVAKS